MQLPIIGIDPGTTESAYVLWDGSKVLEAEIYPNADLHAKLCQGEDNGPPLYIEMIASYGMPVGKEVFETVLWIGRFVEVWNVLQNPWHLVFRKPVCVHHCGVARAKDPNIRRALLDKYGEVGTKKKPGPLYGIRKDLWSALAVASFAVETKLECSCRIESGS